MGTEEGTFLGLTSPALPIGESGPAGAEDALALLERQQAEWQALLSRLKATGVPESELSLCRYQLYHLRLSQSAIGVGTPAGT